MSCDNYLKLNQYVGQQIRYLRTRADYNLAEVASKLNISYQQLQKYETGANNLSVARLHQIAELFGVAPDQFFPPQAQTADIEKIQDPTLKGLICNLIHRLSL